LVVYGSRDVVVSGVPLGGMGAGKVEINNKGKMINITIANNWQNPIKTMPGFHIMIAPCDSPPFFAEVDLPFKDQFIKEPLLTYIGYYPFTRLRAELDHVESNIEFFSPIIRNDIDNSSLPAIGIEAMVSGSSEGLIAVSITNLVGSSPIGRINRKISNGVFFENKRASSVDPRQGNMSLIANNPSIIIPQFNSLDKPRRALLSRATVNDVENIEPWISIARNKDYNGDIHELSGFWEQATGIIVSRYVGGEPVRFVFSWFFNNKWVYYPYGHYYANHFRDSIEAANHLLNNFEQLKTKTMEWQTEVESEMKAMKLPKWLIDAVVNSAYILSSSTWLTDDYRFGILEAATRFQLLNTIGGFTYEVGSLPIIYLFPNLEKLFLEMEISKLRSDGYVPHDLGLYSLDSPSDGTTAPPRWKDTNPTLILLAYRYYLRTRDTNFIKTIYSDLLRIVAWEESQDLDKDGVPDCSGDGETGFDILPLIGRCSYVASMHIAGLIAMRNIAQALGFNDDVNRFNSMISKAAKSFAELFNGRFYDTDDSSLFSQTCFLAQLSGEWWSALLGMDDIDDQSRIISSLRWMLDLNGRSSRFCVPNMVDNHGNIVNFNAQTYSSWPRLVFAMSLVGHRHGVEQWLDLAKREWDNLVRLGLVWDQPSRINAVNGEAEEGYLDHYIGSPSLWGFIISEVLRN